MESNFIKANLLEMVYSKKEDTKCSYYWGGGAKILPNRLSISNEIEFTKVKKKGRNLIQATAGQMVGRFTKSETSPLKVFAPYDCRTQIWVLEEFPLFLGYGTIGISGENGIQDIKDAVIFYSNDNWKTIRIYFFRGLGGNPESIKQCAIYLTKHIKKELAI